MIKHFSLIASVFFAVYATYYFVVGDLLLGYLYTAILAGVIASFVMFRYTKNESFALGVLASLGLPVLIPWQINGGIAGAGIFWYYIYIIWLFFLLGRSRGLLWVIASFCLSVGEFVLQRLGYLPTPYALGTMLSFYFGFILESAVLFGSQTIKEKSDRLLIDEKTKLQSILDNVAEGVVASGPDGKFIFFNKAAETILGVGMSQQNPTAWQKTYGVFKLDKVTPVPVDDFPLTKALQGEVSQSEQYIKNKKLKKGAYILVNGSPLRNPEGEIIGGIAIFSDITAHAEAVEKVSTERAKAEAMLNGINEGLIVFDKNGHIERVNTAAEAILGYRKDEMIGKSYTTLAAYNNKGNEIQADKRPAYRTLLHGKGFTGINLNYRRKDGRIFPVKLSIAPIVLNDTVLGAIEIFYDTTSDKQLEKIKDEFLSVASHELRTPMGAVRANLAMILAGDYGSVNKRLIEPLSDMKESTIRLTELVSDLLDVARIEAGRMKFTFSNFDIQKVVRDTISTLVPLGKEQGLQILFTPEKTMEVQADAGKVGQILTNLIDNAIKFTDHGTITITTSMQDDVVEIAVTDTGIGITLEDQKKLFSKFNQITTAQKGKPAGTGLGLYLSRETIRKMGGDLWIKNSAPGKGSTFIFAVPCSKSMNAKKAKQALERRSELNNNSNNKEAS